MLIVNSYLALFITLHAYHIIILKSHVRQRNLQYAILLKSANLKAGYSDF